MRSTSICVDANVVIRLVAPNPDYDVFDLWQAWRSAGHQILAPTLLRFEATNAFHRMSLAGNIEPDLANELLALVLDLPITYVSDPWLHHEALALARRFGLNASYDAHYVALAHHLGVQLWTLDRRLYNSVHSHLDFVRLIGEA